MKDPDFDNYILQRLLVTGQYKTSQYKTFIIHKPKEREIFKLPYWPDRITHHAIMNVLEPIWKTVFISHTYSCIKGRGIKRAVDDIKHDLKKYPNQTKYCLKLDIRKFYPSIDHDILKEIIRKKIKDTQLLKILDEIIDSSPGVPIGNYLSQYFANLYLTYFDHWVKEVCKVKFYYRYADDIVVLSDSKEFLHNCLIAFKFYLKYNLKLQIKPNYQVFPVDARGIDFLGYVFRHTHIRLRKSIKKRMFRAKKVQGVISYQGWLKPCNSTHLMWKLANKHQISLTTWEGQDIGFLPQHVTQIRYIYRFGKVYLCFLYDRKSYKYRIK